MLPLVAFLAVAQAPYDQPPRLRTVLPNGAIVLVDRIPRAKSLIVDLFVSSRGAEESPETAGRRHLLEHIVALGADGRLDTRLETAGGFLTARTMRDSTEFEMSLPPDGMKAGLAGLRALLAAPSIDADGISREARIIAEEGAEREDAARASEAAWRFTFGPNGLDSFGDLTVIGSTTPDDLQAVRRRTFAANNIAVVVDGDVDLDGVTRQVSEVLSLLPDADQSKPRPPVVPQEGTTKADVRGEYRAVVVPGIRSPSTAATLAAALGLSLEIPGSGIIYTPSARPGLILIGSAEGGLAGPIGRSNAASLFAVGRLAAIRWLRNRLADPSSEASMRGMLLVSERDLRPETILENLDSLRFADFKQAVDSFKSGCTIVQGTR